MGHFDSKFNGLKDNALEIEQYSLSAILKYPDILAELPAHIDHTFYRNSAHQMAFKVIRQRYISNQPITAILIAQSLEKQGYKTKDEIDIKDYLEHLELKALSKNTGMKYFEEMKNMVARRSLYKIAEEIANLASSNRDLNEEALMTLATQAFNQNLTLTNSSLEPVDLYDDSMIEAIQACADNPIEEYGLKIPYPTMNRIYGGLVPGEVFAVVARPGQGKTTFLKHMTNHMALLDPSIKILDIDTEMQTKAIRFRNAAAQLGIPLWFLRTGNFIKNPKYKALFEEKKHELLKLKGRVFHVHVPEAHIDQIISMCKRWRHGRITDKDQPLIIYDYIKLTGESSYNKKEYELIGEKVNKLKKLTTDISAPLATACQLNREAEMGRDDSGAIAQSDRLQWFGAQIGIFRRKTPEEIAYEGGKYGTHNWIQLKSRDQGQDGKGHDDFIEISQEVPGGKNGKKKIMKIRKPNYISFKVENFNVEDMGCLEDIMKKQGALDISDEEEKGAEDLSF